MKKTLIIVGLTILMLVGAVWAYLFIFGVPNDAGEVFGRFQGDPSTTVFTGNDSDSTIDVAPLAGTGTRQRLQQLTTRPVAGAVAFDGTIRYVERGTGYVYDIDLQSGEESIVSGTTIPKTVDAVFSPYGETLALTTITNGVTEVVVGTIPENETGGNFDGEMLPRGATEIAFTTSSSTVYYYLPSFGGGTAYLYNLISKKSSELFTTPLRDVRIIWGESTYIYTTPTAQQTGHIYKVVKNQLEYLHEGGFGLTGLSYASGLVYTKIEESGPSSYILPKNGASQKTPLPLIPEKCAAHQKTDGVFYCAVPTNLAEGTYPDDWYKGTLSYSDTLWEIQTLDGEAIALSDPLRESGREIDVSRIGIDNAGKLIYFINKNDSTLWIYNLEEVIE